MGKKFTIKAFKHDNGRFTVTLHLRQRFLGKPDKNSALYDLLVVLITQANTNITLCDIQSHTNPCVVTIEVLGIFAKIHIDNRRAAESVCKIANEALEIVLAS